MPLILYHPNKASTTSPSFNFEFTLPVNSYTAENSAFVDSSGNLWVRGNNTNNKMGVVGGTGANLLVWTQSNITNVAQVSIGTTFVLVLKKDGTVWACGKSGNYYQIGSTQYTAFTQIMSNAKQISVGTFSTSILKNDGTAWICGTAGSWTTGTVNGTTSYTQLAITGLKQVISGNNNTIILKENGDVLISGQNQNGQLCQGNTTAYTGFLTIATDAKQVSLSGNNSVYIVKNNGDLYSAGNNSQGQLGNGTSLSVNSSLTLVASDVAYVQSGPNSALIIKSDGTAYQSGSAPVTITKIFTKVSVAGTFKGIAICVGCSFLVGSDNILWGAGSQNAMQLDGTGSAKTSYMQIANIQ